MGSLLGDFIKGRVDDTALAPTLRHGVQLHRRIDTYTDAHPLFRQSKRRLRQPYYRYGGILIDIFYDHFLARHWDDYCSLPLDPFCRLVYAALENHYPILPTSMQRSVRYMLATDLLQSYGQLDGIHRALIGVERRLKRPSGLSLAIHDLRHKHAEIDADFTAFFPDLIAYARHHNALS